MAKRSLLLVDGDARSLRVLEVSLKKAGFTVQTAPNGGEALERVAAAPPDLIISDTEMPEMDGFELCRRLKERPEWAHIPFVFLTAQTAIEHKIRGLELGVNEYLTKPIYIKEILTRVRILLQKQDRASIEARKDPNTRFAGALADMGVVDSIQTVEVSRKSGLIHLVGEDARQATLYFRNGKVIDAECGHLAGEDAVHRLLTWNEGEFEVLFRNVRRRDAIAVTTQALLMEGMRRLDEWSRLAEQMPPLTSRFAIDFDHLAERLADLPDDHNRILRLFDGTRTAIEVIDCAELGDLEALELVAQLYFEGYLREAAAEETAHDGLVGARPGRATLTPSPPADGERVAVDDPAAAARSASSSTGDVAAPPPGARPDEADMDLRAFEEGPADDPGAPGETAAGPAPETPFQTSAASAVDGEAASAVDGEAASAVDEATAVRDRTISTTDPSPIDEVVELEAEAAPPPGTLPDPAAPEWEDPNLTPVRPLDLVAVAIDGAEPADPEDEPVITRSVRELRARATEDSAANVSYVDTPSGPSKVVSSRGAEFASASGELSGASSDARGATPAREIVTISPRRGAPGTPVVVLPSPIDPASAPLEPVRRRPAASSSPPRGREPTLAGGLLLALLGAAVIGLAVAGLFWHLHRDDEGGPLGTDVHEVTTTGGGPGEPGPAPVTAPAPAAVTSLAPDQPKVDRLADARALRRRGKLAEAAALVEADLAERPSAAGFALKAEILAARGDKEGALAAAERALERAPHAASSWLALGQLQADLGHRDQARAALLRYLELAPRAKNVAEIQKLVDTL